MGPCARGVLALLPAQRPWAAGAPSLHESLVPSEEPPCQFQRVDAREAGAPARFAELRSRAPVVVTNAMGGWAALGTWGPEALKARVGDMEVGSEDVHPGVLGDGWEEGMRLASIMDATSSKPRLLLFRPQSPVVQMLKADFKVPSLLEAVQRHGPQLSIGGLGQAAMFNHHVENWLAQVYGRKLWMVHPPNVFGVPAYADSSHPCQYLEIEKQLNASQRLVSSCVIHPGEILFLPEQWPHSTCNLDRHTVGVGYLGAIDHMSAPERAAVLGRWPELEVSLATPTTDLGRLLELASESGHVAVMKALLERRAEPTRANAEGRTALHSAAKSGLPGPVRLLLEARAVLDAKDNQGHLPAVEAAYAGDLAVLRALCGCAAPGGGTVGPGPCAVPETHAGLSGRPGAATLLQSAAAGGHLPVARFLFGEGGLAERTSSFDIDSSLARAASKGHTPLVDFLVGRRADVDSRARDGRPPVAWGARHGHVSAIDRLLEHGANLSRESRTGQTALVVAVRYRQAAAAQALLGRGIAVDAVDAQRRTPLHHAAAAGMRAAVDLLVGARVSVSARDSQGRTAVDEAARRDLPGVVQRLLDGAGREARGLAGRALLVLDAEEAHADVAGAAGPETRRVLEGALRQDREL